VQVGADGRHRGDAPIRDMGECPLSSRRSNVAGPASPGTGHHQGVLWRGLEARAKPKTPALMTLSLLDVCSRSRGDDFLSLWMQAVYSSRPLNVIGNTWWFFTLSLCGFLISLVFYVIGIPSGTSEGAVVMRLFISPFLYGGQPLPTGRGPVFRLVPESKINSSAHGLPLGFAASHTTRSSMSLCGLASPPKLVIDNEDGSMTLTYPPENRPDRIHGMFFVPGTCNNDRQDAANCLADTSYRFQVADGDDEKPLLSVPLKAGTETRSGFKATHYHALHTPWPAYFAPGGAGIVGLCGLGAAAVLKLMGKTQ
jgi:hypothetical protein